MNDKKYTLGEVAAIGIITPLMLALIMLISVPISLFEAWIRSTLWNWFVAPYFHLNPIKISVMFMFGYIVTLFYPLIPQDKENKWYTLILGVVLVHLIALIFGYFIHQRF
jgi:uncharacterized BrkB/YihY/UPF0761 family membrane protein